MLQVEPDVGVGREMTEVAAYSDEQGEASDGRAFEGKGAPRRGGGVGDEWNDPARVMALQESRNA